MQEMWYTHSYVQEPHVELQRDHHRGAQPFVGPGGIQAIFDELASELGESIPETVIEAQRMRVASQDFDAWKKFGAGEFRELLAVLGFGNMISFEASDGTYSATIENAALSLMIVGTALGALEAITGKKATAEWSLDPDGDLQISVREA